MTRDYKDRPTGRGRSGRPVLTGVIIGLLLGIGIAVAIAYYVNWGPSPFVNRVRPTEPAAKPASDSPPQQASGDAAGEQARERPRFDFYTILPAEKSEPSPPQTLAKSAPAAEREPKPAPPAQPEPKPATEKPAARQVYYLQAGSFQQQGDADKLKAKLALMGYEASVKTVALADRGTWHRVRLGPYSNAEELNRVRSALSQSGIPASVVKPRNGTNQ